MKTYNELYRMTNDLANASECCKECQSQLGYTWDDIAEHAHKNHEYYMAKANNSMSKHDDTLFNHYESLAKLYIDMFQNDHVYIKSKYFKGYGG